MSKPAEFKDYFYVCGLCDSRLRLTTQQPVVEQPTCVCKSLVPMFTFRPTAEVVAERKANELRTTTK